MKKERIQHKSGLTLIEVMISLVIILIIAIGVMGYMYATAKNAREADVRATAARIGLLLLEGWRTQLGDTSTYDPQVDFDSGTTIPFDEFASITASTNPPGLTSPFKYYRIGLNGIKYFVKMSFVDNAGQSRLLNVAIAWSRDYSSGTLEYSSSRMVSQTKYAYYTVQ
jgi:prepilin-type N-terminal cleavage/methylation domain-containing protein